MNADKLDFHLPPELIAQVPMPDRAASRLLHYTRSERGIAHKKFSDLPRFLRAGDLMVFNNARVIPARFMLEKSTGGKVEGLFLQEIRTGTWRVLLKNLGNATRLNLSGVDVEVVEKGDAGECVISLSTDRGAMELLEQHGRMPLPPYIKRDKQRDERDEFDRERYQTVFAKEVGAVAAPTAGLHFNDELMRELDAVGIERAFVTLHVGMGTFKPITAERLEDHEMHSEAYTIDATAAEAINRAKLERRRVIAVGTTSARVLESQPAGQIAPMSGATSIFIYPPYEWKHVGAMITNFHLPRSTLIAMIAAFVGLDEQRRIYAEAIRERYRFFSYGDAMLLE